jgi:flavin-dependent dehydrogenase
MCTGKFDVIIIGSSPAGMATGSLFAVSGKKVLIVDSGNRLGGQMCGKNTGHTIRNRITSCSTDFSQKTDKY